MKSQIPNPQSPIPIYSRSSFIIHHSSLYCRRGGVGNIIIVFMLILAGIFIVARILMQRNEEKVAAVVQAAQLDPQESLNRFYIERSGAHSFREGTWRTLLDFMSPGDRAWLEKNCGLVVVVMKGSSLSGATQPELEYEALKQLLGFGPGASRPVIVQVASSDKYGVAYVHEPGQIQTMREVFLESEGGLWKIRRFLGARDNPAFLAGLIKEKLSHGQTLDEDEKRFQANPQTYAAQKRAELLKEAGQTPQGGQP